MRAQGRKKQDIFHTSAYARAQGKGATLGAASTQGFAERREIEQNRTLVRGYGDAQVSQGVNNARPLDAQELQQRAVQRAERAREMQEWQALQQEMAQRREQQKAQQEAADTSEEQTATRQYEIVKDLEEHAQAPNTAGGAWGMQKGAKLPPRNYQLMKNYREAQKERFVPKRGVGGAQNGGPATGVTPMRRVGQFRIRSKGA